MIARLRRRWHLSRVKPGDGSRLPPDRSWQLLTRSQFGIELPGPTVRSAPLPAGAATFTLSAVTG